MSYMRGDLLSKTRKLVKGLAKATPVWLKAMEEVPPVTFPRTNGKIKKIVLPEDEYVKKFNRKHPNALYHDAIKLNGFDPPPSRVFAWRVVELKAEGVSEGDAMAVADMEYMAEKKAKKAAYKELKQINRIQGKKPPPNPYPSAIKEIQAEEKKLVRDRFFNPRIHEIVKRLKEEHPQVQAERERYFHHYDKPGGVIVSVDDNTTYTSDFGNGNRGLGNNNSILDNMNRLMNRGNNSAWDYKNGGLMDRGNNSAWDNKNSGMTSDKLFDTRNPPVWVNNNAGPMRSNSLYGADNPPRRVNNNAGPMTSNSLYGAGNPPGWMNNNSGPMNRQR